MAVLATLGAALVLGIALIVLRGKDELVPQEETREMVRVAVEGGEASATPAVERAATEEPRSFSSERTASVARDRSLGVLVTGNERKPVAGAVVSLHAPGDTEVALATSETDDAGGAELPPIAAGETNSTVLWVSHPTHRATAVLMKTLAEPHIVELEQAGTQLVRVVDGIGAPVAGAEILQTALPIELSGALGGAGPLAGNAQVAAEMLPLFRRVHISDDEGRSHVHPCDFAVAVQARAGDACSALGVLRPFDEALELRLIAPVTALGTVRGPAGFADFGELRVDAFQRPIDSIGAAELRLLGTARVAADGAWGPLGLALDSGMLLLFRLRGGDLVPLEIAVDPRVSAPPYVVDFQGERGELLDAFVFQRVGETTVGIEGARVDFRWRDEDSGRSSIVSGFTDAEGRARVTGCKSTTGSARASAIGFVGASQHAVGFPRDMLLELELVPGGTISGVCRSAAGPVADFDVLIWEDQASQHSVHVFRDRHDGSFLVEGAPFGAVQVMGVPSGLPESGVETVAVLPTEVARVELVVPEAVVGRGRVVDAETSAPLANARIVPLVRSALQIIGERGQVFGVDGDGAFEIESFAPREAIVWVAADGYARARAIGSYVAGTGIDFGEVQLARAGELIVRVLADESFDASLLWFRSDGDNPIAYVRLPPDGELRLEGVLPGRHELCLVWPEGNTLAKGVDLVPGRPWIEEFELSTGEEITVDVIAPEGGELIPDTGLFATHRDSKGAPTVRAWFVPPDGRVVLINCAADEVWLEVVDPVGRLLAFSHATFAGSGPRRVSLELTDRSLAVTVLDAEGAPLSDSTVALSTLEEHQPLGIYQSTDGDGRCVFRGLHSDRLLVTAQHLVHGQRTMQVELEPSGTTELELALEETADLPLKIVDGDTILQGVDVRLFGALRSIVMGNRLTNSSGLAVWSKRAPGDFQAHVNHQGIWPTWSAFEFTGDVEPIDVQVRRLGDARMRVVDAQGLVLAGVRMELTSLEFGETVSAWVAAQRVVSESSELVTDAHGEVRVKGLPNGAYRLDVVTLAGATVQQQVVVPPVGTLQHLVLLE